MYSLKKLILSVMLLCALPSISLDTKDTYESKKSATISAYDVFKLGSFLGLTALAVYVGATEQPFGYGFWSSSMISNYGSSKLFIYGSIPTGIGFSLQSIKDMLKKVGKDQQAEFVDDMAQPALTIAAWMHLIGGIGFTSEAILYALDGKNKNLAISMGLVAVPTGAGAVYAAYRNGVQVPAVLTGGYRIESTSSGLGFKFIKIKDLMKKQ